MFGIGFFELVTLGLVGLVVLGPEKLPGTIRTMSLWIGRLRRNFNNIKSEIEKEIGADEIRRQLRNEEIMEKFRNTQSKVQNSIKSIKDDAETFRKNVELEADAAAGKISGESKDKGEAKSSDTGQDSASASEQAATPPTADQKAVEPPASRPASDAGSSAANTPAAGEADETKT